MKKFAATILLICYSVALIRPVLPILSDVMAHTFWRAHHLATVHFENGKYHVHYDLQAAAKEDQSNKKSSSVKTDETLDVHIIGDERLVVNVGQQSSFLFQGGSEPPLSVSINIDTPPPWA